MGRRATRKRVFHRIVIAGSEAGPGPWKRCELGALCPRFMGNAYHQHARFSPADIESRSWQLRPKSKRLLIEARDWIAQTGPIVAKGARVVRLQFDPAAIEARNEAIRNGGDE